MAFLLRLPDDLDQALEAQAEAEHSTKHALALESVRAMLKEREHQRLVMEGAEHIMTDHAETLRRLADS
ncbi:hypothetical protein [Rothia halotolerans]|uniref:hypothetical protein n=1 Tax=Rothia halotolerans TaxID=405770 RepID=UPI00101CFA3C|nr:hypothetical protein [Rothia halotolerans]